MGVLTESGKAKKKRATKTFGFELIIDLDRCDPGLFSPENVERFCKELCIEIGMVAEDFHLWASEPEDYDDEPDHIHGVSAIQFITTSNITVHTLIKRGTVFVNIFSCKHFDPDAACVFCLRFFNGRITAQHFIMRGRP